MPPRDTPSYDIIYEDDLYPSIEQQMEDFHFVPEVDDEPQQIFDFINEGFDPYTNMNIHDMSLADSSSDEEDPYNPNDPTTWSHYDFVDFMNAARRVNITRAEEGLPLYSLYPDYNGQPVLVDDLIQSANQYLANLQ